MCSPPVSHAIFGLQGSYPLPRNPVYRGKGIKADLENFILKVH